jgi:hypothetical protein
MIDFFELIRVKQLFIIPKTVWFYFFALLLGYTAVGWLLTAFGASRFVWLGTLAVTFHLALSGTEAILLANAWVLMVVFTAVLRKTWPLFLGGYLPYKNAPLWAIIMIILWFLAIFFMVFLAWTRQKLQTMGWNERQAYLSLVALTWVALATGWMVFQLSFP